MKAIDLFAGAGGFSEGARAAGVNVVWAANHWPAAVAVHPNWLRRTELHRRFQPYEGCEMLLLYRAIGSPGV